MGDRPHYRSAFARGANRPWRYRQCLDGGAVSHGPPPHLLLDRFARFVG